jgi:tetratricopeptide (TPR) repeat protein
MRRAAIRVLGLAAALLALSLAGARPAAAAEVALRPVPTPSTEALEPNVRQQVEEARASLDRRLAAGETSGPGLEGDFQRVGLLYYLYDLGSAAEPCLLNARDLAPEDFRWPYYLGVLAQSGGDYEGAMAHFRRALELAPDDVPTQLRLADIQLEVGDLEAAGETYARHRDGPAAAAAVYGLGRIAEYQGDAARAAELFERALELQPGADGIHHRLGMAYRALGDLAKAQEHLEKNRGTQVRFPDPLVEGLGQLLQASQVYFKAGIEALKNGDAAAAIPHLLKARELNEDDPLVHYNLALAYLHLEDEKAAEASLRRSVEVEPAFRNGWFNLGTLLARQNRVVEAEASFRRAYEIDAEDAEAHHEWAVALATLGRTAEARAEFEKLIAEHPTDVQSRLDLAVLLQDAGDTDGSLAQLESASAAGSPEADERRAALLEGLGRLDEALAAFEAAGEGAPESVEIQEQWGLALGRAGRFAEAAERFEAAVALEPARKSAHMGRAMSRLLEGDEAAARAALEAGLAALPDDVELSLLLARLLVAGTVDALRDGPWGLELAEALEKRNQGLEEAQTLAMAYAEVGRFEEAVALQRRVVGELQRLGHGREAERARRRLERYENGQPCRAPWKDG